LEISNRNYLKDIEAFEPQDTPSQQFKKKMMELKERLRQMREKDKKIEL
jgi:hypothetical protein